MNEERNATGTQPGVQDVVRTVEEWVALKRPAAFALAAAKVMNGWVVGARLTEAQFDAGMNNQPVSR